jgi:hypothetical protein
LRGKSGYPQGLETSRLSGEEYRLSFRPRTLKVGTEIPAEPAPERGLPWRGEWFGKDRLEQR